MRLGLMLPTMGAWFDRAAIAEVCSLAEDLGFASLWLGDHVVAPTRGTPEHVGVEPLHRWDDQAEQARADPSAWPTAAQYFGERFLDVYVTWMHVLDRTTRVRVGSSIVVLPYRNPLVQAKMIATLDELSGGRIIFGIGSGHIEAESEVLGQPYADRGAMTDEWLRLILACLTVDEVSFQGRWFSFEGARPLLHTVQKPHPPILIGGNSRRSIRRAVEFGQGWHPSDLTPDEIRQAKAYLTAEAERAGRPDVPAISLNFFVRLVPESTGQTYRVRPRLTAEEAVERFRAYAAAGVSEVAVFLPTYQRELFFDQLRLVGESVLPQIHDAE